MEEINEVVDAVDAKEMDSVLDGAEATVEAADIETPEVDEDEAAVEVEEIETPEVEEDLEVEIDEDESEDEAEVPEKVYGEPVSGRNAPCSTLESMQKPAE